MILCSLNIFFRLVMCLPLVSLLEKELKEFFMLFLTNVCIIGCHCEHFLPALAETQQLQN